MVEGREFHSPKDYLDLARLPSATGEELRELSRSEYVFVRMAVAEHPATPSEALADLMPPKIETWNDGALVLVIVRNPSTGPDVLRQVPGLVLPGLHTRNDNNAFAAGVALAKRQDTPEDLLIQLISDPLATTEFRKVIARETTHPTLIQHLRADASKRVRNAAARRSPSA